jgi:hypothetical protein
MRFAPTGLRAGFRLADTTIVPGLGSVAQRTISNQPLRVGLTGQLGKAPAEHRFDEETLRKEDQVVRPLDLPEVSPHVEMFMNQTLGLHALKRVPN